MVKKGTHRGSDKDDGHAVGAGTSTRVTAPRRQPPHGVGTRRRQSPLAVALFLSKKGKRVRPEPGLTRARSVSNASRCNGLPSVVLTLDVLRQITNNFSDDQILGEGALGKVYKGVLKNGDMIAVKRFPSTIAGLQDVVQYENEAQHLMRLKHPNIVQLVGYCSETELKLVRHNGTFVRAEETERLLCLEYMPKGSLRDHLSDESSGLDWNMRYNIIEGISYGLHYLHEEQVTPIIHRDLKPANILLDDNMMPKIADFGLSRLFGEEQTRTCTTSCKGTPGYMAPEYLEKGVITKKFDIFSLGVIIIEIVTGLRVYPADETETTSQQYIDLVLNNWRHRLRKAEGYIYQDIDYQQIQKCIQIGLLCVRYDPLKRPTINQIIKMVERSDEAYQNEREFCRLLRVHAEPMMAGRQLLSQAMAAIAHGNHDAAVIHLEALKRLGAANKHGDAQQRVTAIMVAALSSRIFPAASSPAQHVADLYGVEQRAGFQLLQDISPCFRVAMHAASVAIVEAVGDHPGAIRLFDFNVSFRQHAALIQYLADGRVQSRSLNVTTFTDPSSPFAQSLIASLLAIGERLKKLAELVGVEYNFEVVSCSAAELDMSRLCWEPGEAVAVNLAFALSDVPDESVSTANHRDRLLRCVRWLGPQVVTLVEQELNTNTAPLATRFTEACAHYGAILESLDATWEWGNADRARAEKALWKKAADVVVRDGPDRLERCEVFGKWRARFGMAGFRPVSLSSDIAEQLIATRVGPVPPGFTVKAEDGVLRFCWRGRVVTVASAWH